MVKVVLISGKQGSGKTTLSEQISTMGAENGYGSVRVLKFADVLYELHEYILNKVEGYTGVKRVEKDGELLQLLGTEWGRKKLGDNIWVDILKGKIQKLRDSNLGSPMLVLVDDCRFKNEFDGFPDALRVRLDANELIRMRRTKAWRHNTQHPSEIDLDHYASNGRFDLYFHTDKTSVEECAKDIYEILKADNYMNERTRAIDEV